MIRYNLKDLEEEFLYTTKILKDCDHFILINSEIGTGQWFLLDHKAGYNFIFEEFCEH